MDAILALDLDFPRNVPPFIGIRPPPPEPFVGLKGTVELEVEVEVEVDTLFG